MGAEKPRNPGVVIGWYPRVPGISNQPLVIVKKNLRNGSCGWCAFNLNSPAGNNACMNYSCTTDDTLVLHEDKVGAYVAEVVAQKLGCP